ncbi:hypothetical protein Patl1_34439 [Pistacia atlantica]|uniref:Uncharacterized protein n=1 Tax=Pistacia atlantica TaxID=434234 RepID=A0ACC0ZS60_9ROSI|nr:hypothetical protein Patl1_34439 [Pistacia atlantica]
MMKRVVDKIVVLADTCESIVKNCADKVVDKVDKLDKLVLMKIEKESLMVIGGKVVGDKEVAAAVTEVDQRADVVEVDVWNYMAGRKGLRCDWLIREFNTSKTLIRATS